MAKIRTMHSIQALVDRAVAGHPRRRGWLFLGLLGCLVLTACGGFRLAGPSPEPYRLLKFDSETGQFDPRIEKAAQPLYWQQWKKARQLNLRLNPDDAHGRPCGTHPYLHSRWLLTSRLLPDFAFFLIRPGWRPCDYDEPCTPVTVGPPVTCAHTQDLWDYPVVVGPQGTPYRDTLIDRAFFNSLIQSRPVTIDNAGEAEQVARLYLFLTTTGSRHTRVEIEALEARPEGRHFQVRARLRTPPEPEIAVKFFEVAADGSIVAND